MIVIVPIVVSLHNCVLERPIPYFSSLLDLTNFLFQLFFLLQTIELLLLFLFLMFFIFLLFLDLLFVTLQYLLLVLQLLFLTLPLLHLMYELFLYLFLYFLVNRFLFLPGNWLFFNVRQTPIVETFIEPFCHWVLSLLGYCYIFLPINICQPVLHFLIQL